MIVKENTKEYVCVYGHRFIGKDVKLIPFKNMTQAVIGTITFVKSEDEGYYRGGRPLEGYLLACPHCGVVQFGGFVSPKDKQLVATVDIAPKRNIQLSL